jgi:DNA-binding NtrC family response regulator
MVPAAFASAAPHVLLVDDDPSLRLMMSRRLLHLGCEVVTAASAQEATDHLDDNTFDVALLDIMMPGTTGLELLKITRARLPSLPVVMLTASDSARHVVDAWHLGAYDYLMKPARSEQLLSLVASAVQQTRRGTGRPAVARIKGQWSQPTVLVSAPTPPRADVAHSHGEADYVRDLLLASRGDVDEAARRAGLDRVAFRRLMHRALVRGAHPSPR